MNGLAEPAIRTERREQRKTKISIDFPLKAVNGFIEVSEIGLFIESCVASSDKVYIL